ncbi:ATP-binding protein [Parageobacillus thermoglucosidasius]|jgi:energy-coupling factor transporter ATP-binding protein EcfA2|uniref:ATP-binding protein n=1 Tax=Parageobacillus thermoglucosidasius TaxID=1426 RepID=UPI001FCAD97B|nr:ATP-binding protein [Parageobacillus thermoglucosidasius]BDG30460.1 hypothetical protein PthBH41_01720 [Parageobacillus thermoglucosidasius]
MSFVEANYSESVISDYFGNPLIEALPPILSVNEVIEALSVFPEYDAKERHFSQEHRFHCIQRLFRYFQPFERHIELEQKLSRIIRQGYISRNPLSKNNAVFMNQSYNALKQGKILQTTSMDYKKYTTGFTIIGYSGIGKTTSIERVLSLYPQVIKHSYYKKEHLNFIQVPWLKVDCPFDGSLKGLCINFFDELDKVLGTNYVTKFAKRTINTDHMLQKMRHIARLHCIGILVVDEIQHLNFGKSGGSEKMLNFFVTLVNTIGIPVILIGTNKAVSILQREFRQARRGSGQGDMVWGKMEKGDDWDLFIEGLWDYQWTRKKAELTQELKDILYEESQGIIDIAIKLFMVSQMKAISNNSEILTGRLIKQVARDNFKLLRPMLDALKSGDPSLISEYEDITPINFQEIMNNFKEKIDIRAQIRMLKKQQEEKTKKLSSSLKQELALKLCEFNFLEAEIIEESINKVLENKNVDEAESSALVKEVLELALKLDKEKKAKKSKRKRNENPIAAKDLRALFSLKDKNKSLVYTIFLENDLIKDPLKDFVSR